MGIKQNYSISVWNVRLSMTTQLPNLKPLASKASNWINHSDQLNKPQLTKIRFKVYFMLDLRCRNHLASGVSLLEMCGSLWLRSDQNKIREESKSYKTDAQTPYAFPWMRVPEIFKTQSWRKQQLVSNPKEYVKLTPKYNQLFKHYYRRDWEQDRSLRNRRKTKTHTHV